MASFNPTHGTLPWTKSSMEEKEKVIFLRRKYATIWIARIVRITLLFFLFHCFVSLVSYAGLVLLNPVVETNQHLNGPPGLLHYKLIEQVIRVVRGFVTGMFNHWTVWIFLACTLQTCVMAYSTKVSRVFPTTRREILTALFSSSSPLALLCVLIGASNAFLTHCYLNILYFGMDDEVKNDGLEQEECPSVVGPSSVCWNDQQRAIVSLSAMASIFVFLIQYNELKFVLSFPVLDLAVPERIRLSFRLAYKDCVSYIVFLTGLESALFVFTTMFFMTPSKYLGNIMKFGIFFNLPFFLHMVIWPSFMIFSMKLCWRLVEVALTEKLELPIEPSYPISTDVITLSDAMSSAPPLMKHLAFYELYGMACMPCSQLVTEQFFTLSHPGRHPRNWTGILDAALHECSNLTRTLNDYVQKRRTSVVAPTVGATASFSATVLTHSDIDPNDLNFRRRTLLAQTHMRDLTTHPLQSNLPTRRSFIFTPQMLQIALKHLYNRFWDYQIAPRISRFRSFMDEKEFQLELANILSSKQLIIWGANAVVGITRLSFVHDNHGIVQRDIRRIISVLLNLHDALKEVIQLTTRNSHSPPTKNTKVTDELVRQLFSSLSYCLTCLNHSFSAYYEVLGIPEENIQKLKNLTTMKQGSTTGTRFQFNH